MPSTMRRSNAPSRASRSAFQPPLAKMPRLETSVSPAAPRELLRAPIRVGPPVNSGPAAADEKNDKVSLLDLIRNPEKIQLSDVAKQEKKEKGHNVRLTSDRANLVVSKDNIASVCDQKTVDKIFMKANVDVAPGSRREVIESPSHACVSDAIYFSCVYGKQSNRKHKKWMGDGVACIKGRTLTLKDSEGKTVATTTLKTSDAQNLGDGDRTFVGSFEVELGDPIPASSFMAGSCFDAGSGGAASAGAASSPAALTSKPFKVPLTKRDLNEGTVTNSAGKAEKIVPVKPSFQNGKGLYKPFYDASAPDAFVLPRPGVEHRRRYNGADLEVTDVVVDPRLARTLRPHQKKGVIFLYRRIMGFSSDSVGFGAVLADAMGLGKTLQCIALIWALLKHGPYGNRPVLKRVVVVTPGSLVKNWVKEFDKWLGSQKLSVYAVGTHNQNERRAEDYHKFAAVCPVVVVSYEMFNRNFDALKSVKFDLLICDEGHRLKNTSTQTWKQLSSLETRRRIVLTGTPLQNDLQELFAIAEFCNPGHLGTPTSFKRVYEDPISQSRQPESSAEEKELGQARASSLQRLVADFVLRRTEEVNEVYLPPKVETSVFCRASSTQRAIYRRLLDGRFLRSALASENSASHFACISALKKLCNHPGLLLRGDGVGDLRNEIESVLTPFGCGGPEESGKLRVLIRMLERLHLRANETGRTEKVVVVSNWTSTLDVIQGVCASRGFAFLRLDGATPVAKRQGLVDRFNARIIPGVETETVFLLSSKAGGVGLNLVGASTLILFDIDWNPANDLQAMARVWRDGQKRLVRIYRLLTTGSIEEKIFQRQISKQGLSGAVVDAKELHQGKTIHFSKEDLRDLFVFDEKTDSSTHDLLNCDCLKDVDEATCDQEGNLVAPAPTSLTKFQGIDELREWSHLKTPFDEDFDDDLLFAAEEDVSMIFSNVTEKNENC